MQYGLLNIEQDPLAQDYAPHSFDVVLAVQVVHATADVETSLRNLRTLLGPGGVLLMVEELRALHFHNVSFAMLQGWWRFSDFRRASPICDRGEWERVLQRAGFSDVRGFELGLEHKGGVIFGRAPAPSSAPLLPTPMKREDEEAKAWVLFGTKTPLAAEVGARIRAAGRRVVHATPTGDEASAVGAMEGGEGEDEYALDFLNPEHFGDVFRSISRVEGCVYLCLEEQEDLDQIEAAGKRKIAGLLHLLQFLTRTLASGGAKGLKVVLLGRGMHYLGDQSEGNPLNATAWGAFRSFINECRELSCRIIDVDQDDEFPSQTNSRVVSQTEQSSVSTFDVVDEICAALWTTPSAVSNAVQNGVEKFILLRGGKKYVQRVAAAKPAPPLALPLNTERFEATNPASGSFADIRVVPCGSIRPTTGKEVEVSKLFFSRNKTIDLFH